MDEMPDEIRGTDPKSREDARLLERIIFAVKGGPRDPAAILLLGRSEFYAMSNIKDASLMAMKNDVLLNHKFYGMRVMFVDEKSLAQVVM